ncbi:MAG TPA: hypothetical protein VIV11_42270 [Kofleriaceae bacterium]
MFRRILTLILVLGSSVAYAQRAPDMATLDRGDGITKFGFDLGFSSLEEPPYSAALRFDIYGQYVTDSGLGIYGDLPISRSFGGDGEPCPPQFCNATGLGNLDLGLLYVRSGETLSWVFRGGAALPTSNDGPFDGLTRVLATGPRLTDIALASNDWYFRLSVSPLIHLDRVFLRADIGLDIDIGSEDYHLLRINAGGGIDLGTVALSLELVNTATFGDFDGNDEDFYHALAFTVRFMGEQLQPFLSVGTPIDEYRRDVIKFWIAGGLQVAF